MTDDPATKIDEGHMFEPHYALHVWLHRDNPAGVFSQFNPDVSWGAQAGARRSGREVESGAAFRLGPTFTTSRACFQKRN